MADYGITAYGAYIPRLRIDRAAIAAAHGWMAPSLKSAAKGSRSFCCWDEDAITMAVEAARDCVPEADRGSIETLLLASTTLPYADLQSGAIVAGALGLCDGIASADIAHSQRAGTSALLLGLRGRQRALVVASDQPNAKAASVQELSYGAGAAALSLGHEGVIATFLGASTTTTTFVDHFRAAESKYDYFWEERWIRDEGYAKLVPPTLKSALENAGVSLGEINHFVMASMQRGAAEAVAKKVGFAGSISNVLDNECGYAGAAHPLLMLAHTLEQAKAGDIILLIGFGQGVDAIVLRVTPAIETLRRGQGVSGALADKVQTDSYLRMLSYYGGIDVEWGMRAEKSGKTALTEQYRSADQTAAFAAGRCQSCGTIQFPQLQYCVKPGCHKPSSQFEPVSLVDAPCQVLTFTADWLTYHPAPPLYVGFVQYENGARLLMEIVDVGASGIDVGSRLRNVFRVKEIDRPRGYKRYFWKATPISVTGVQ